jgi:ADP-heptose:LPS heptosyltransferase
MKVLVIRFSSIGDIVLTTPVVRCLKQQLNAEVHYFTKNNFKDVLVNNPYIDKLHFLSDDFNSDVQALKAEQFDCVIDLHHNLRTLRFKQSLSVPSYSFDKLNLEKWMLVNLKWDRMPNMHIVDRYLATTEKLGVRNDQHGLDYFLSENDKVDIKTLPSFLHNGYVGLVIGAQHATKRLPLEKLQELCQKISKPIVLMGGKEDAAIAEELVKIDSNRIFSACGKFKLNESTSMVEQSQCIISHDTGLMHIASAFKKEVYAIWGNTVPEFGMYPYKTKYHNFEVKDLACRPCSKIGHQSCPKKHFKCMNNQNIDLLAQMINQTI